MPTGYTAKIKDGITFNEYAMSCARAFGALVMMRDEPSDAEIPAKQEPSDYHAKAIEKANSELSRLKNITTIEAEKLATSDWNEKERRRVEVLGNVIELKEKYTVMLAQVDKWVPPTSEHEGMHKFMREQIKGSIKFDCDESYYNEPARWMSGKEWLAESIEKAKHDIEYHTKNNNEEIERTENRNDWISKLRESLA